MFVLLFQDIGEDRISAGDRALDIFRKKQVPLVPMSVEEAVENLQFIGHDFFMFLDKETLSVQVVYKRTEEGYGVLTPVLPKK